MPYPRCARPFVYANRPVEGSFLSPVPTVPIPCTSRRTRSVSDRSACDRRVSGDAYSVMMDFTRKSDSAEPVDHGLSAGSHSAGANRGIVVDAL